MAYTIWLKFDVDSWWKKVDASYIGIFLQSKVSSCSSVAILILLKQFFEFMQEELISFDKHLIS